MNWEQLSFPVYLPQNFSAYIINQSLINITTFLSKIRQNLNNTYQSPSNSFTYYDSYLVSSYFPNYRPTYKTLSVSPFNLKNEKSHTYHYYSGNLMNQEFDNIRSSFNFSGYMTDNTISSNASDPEISALLWMGTSGVHSTAHYDTVYNIYIHLAGIKLFRLFPPSEATCMRFHGRFHPHIGQSRRVNLSQSTYFDNSFLIRPYKKMAQNISQSRSDSNSNSQTLVFELDYETYESNHLDIFTESTTDSTRCRSNGDRNSEKCEPSLPLQFILHPGDIIFIPPFWVHETEVISSSASVSLWWDAAENNIYHDLYTVPLPVELEAPGSETAYNKVQMATLYYFSVVLLKSVQSRTNRHVELMLQALINNNVNATNNFNCNFDIMDVMTLVSQRYVENWTDWNKHCQYGPMFDNSSISRQKYHPHFCTSIAKPITLATILQEYQSVMTTKWTKKISNRTNRLSKIFQKYLDTRKHSCDDLLSVTAAVEKSSLNDCFDKLAKSCQNQVSILQMKFIDFMEDLLFNFFPQEHPSVGLYRMYKLITDEHEHQE